MVDEEFLYDKLAATVKRATSAHARLRETPPDSPHYQEAMNIYLQETIHYMSVVTLAQARQHEMLTEEVAELRARLAALQAPRQLH
jgi:hypothetical protein